MSEKILRGKMAIQNFLTIFYAHIFFSYISDLLSPICSVLMQEPFAGLSANVLTA